MFDFSFVAGEPETAMASPGSVVLTEESSRLHFGDESALGRTLRLQVSLLKADFVVTGVIKDLPRNVSFDFEYLILPPDGWAAGKGW